MQEDGTHFPPETGHGSEGHTPDNPNTNADQYKNYVYTLFSVASEASVITRVNSSFVENLADKVTFTTSADRQKYILESSIRRVDSEVTAPVLVPNNTLTNLSYELTMAKEGSEGQKNTIDDGIVHWTEATSLVNSPVQGCEWWHNCQILPTGTQVNPVIRKIYGTP